MNLANLKKSRYIHKSTKSGKDDNNPEEEELRKYNEVVERLNHLFPNHPRKDISGGHNPESAIESSNIFSSNVRRTTSRTKEMLNDRDFLINFMNDDTMPILPKNMHLLTDDDTNINIDDKTKFKKLADLLLDDKETVKESYFINSVEEKMILKLYTALSRKSKDIFMEENTDNKDKNRILLHKLNNIEIPKFTIEDKDNINSNDNLEESDDDNNLIRKQKKKQKREPTQKINSSNSNSNNILSEINNIRRKTKSNTLLKEKPIFNPDCKYNKKNKSIRIVKIPSLEYKPIRFHNKKSRRMVLPQSEKNEQWEPDIDGDLLAYINHNIVKIEDIYNKGKENIFELKENQDEEVKQIEAKEITYDANQSENNDESEIYGDKRQSIDNTTNYQRKKSLSNISDEEDTEIKNKNKFCEYKDRLPNLIEISLLVEPAQKKISDFHKELKELYSHRINEVGELGEELFPSFGDNLKHKKIYKYALNNERNEEINTDSFTLTGESTNVNASKSKMELKLNLDIDSDNNKNSESNTNNNLSVENSENKNENIENSENKENSNDNIQENENKEEEEEEKKYEEEKKDEEENKEEEEKKEEKLNSRENNSNNLYSLEDDDLHENNNEEQNKENNNNITKKEENKKSEEENKNNLEENKENKGNKNIFEENMKRYFHYNKYNDDEDEEDEF